MRSRAIPFCLLLAVTTLLGCRHTDQSTPDATADTTNGGTPPSGSRQPDERVQAANCLVNLKQLCLGFVMLAGDNNDVLKFTPSGWLKAVAPYIMRKKVLHCPLDKSGNVSYAVNTNLAGVSQTAIANPAETVLVYEGANMKLEFRHDGRAVVGFVDGRVKFVNAAESQSLRWKP